MTEFLFSTEPIGSIENAITGTIKQECPLLTFERIGNLTMQKILDAPCPFGYTTWLASQPGANEDSLDGGSGISQALWLTFHCRFKFSLEGGPGAHSEAYPLFWAAMTAVLGMVPIPDRSSPFELVALGPVEETPRFIYYSFDIRTLIHISCERSEYTV